MTDREVDGLIELLKLDYKDKLQVSVRVAEGVIRLVSLHAAVDATPLTGTSFMRSLCNIADAAGLVITLSPASKGERYSDRSSTTRYKQTSSSSRLEKFYRRFGFVKNSSSRGYRPDISDSMYRYPKTTAE